MKINGKEVNIQYNCLEDLLTKQGYQTRLIAVECNGDIIPKSKYKTFVPKCSDEIEVVSFVGGG